MSMALIEKIINYISELELLLVIEILAKILCRLRTKKHHAHLKPLYSLDRHF